MKIQKVLLYLFLSMFIIYSVVNSIFTDGSVISQLTVLLIIALSIVFLIKTLLQKFDNSLFFKAWTFFLLLNIAGFIARPEFTNGPERVMFKNMLAAILPFYPAYYFSKGKILKIKDLNIFSLCLLPVIIFQFMSVNSFILSQVDAGNTDIVNNVAYSFVGLIPYVFLIKKNRFIALGMLVIITYFIIQGAKRGAILVGLTGMVLFIVFQIKRDINDHKFSSLVLIPVIFILMGYFAYRSFANNDFLIGRINQMLEGDTSNRGFTYGSILDAWYNSDNILQLIFGYGFAASLKIAGGFAHNDWLELLSNFGILGIASYIILFIAAIKSWIQDDFAPDNRFLLGTIIIMWFFTTLISMSYTSEVAFMQSIMLGYLFGNPLKSEVESNTL